MQGIATRIGREQIMHLLELKQNIVFGSYVVYSFKNREI